MKTLVFVIAALLVGIFGILAWNQYQGYVIKCILEDQQSKREQIEHFNSMADHYAKQDGVGKQWAAISGAVIVLAGCYDSGFPLNGEGDTPKHLGEKLKIQRGSKDWKVCENQVQQLRQLEREYYDSIK